MTERVRIVALWMVVAVLAILVLLAPRGASEPVRGPARRVVPHVIPDSTVAIPAAVVSAPAPAPGSTGLDAALAALAGGSTCADRVAAVEALRALGDPVAIPALHAARAHDACVDPAARTAIRELGRNRHVAAY